MNCIKGGICAQKLEKSREYVSDTPTRTGYRWESDGRARPSAGKLGKAARLALFIPPSLQTFTHGNSKIPMTP